MEEKIIYKTKNSILIRKLNTASQPTIFMVDGTDPNSKNIENLVNTYIEEEIKQEEVSRYELELIVHEIVLENILWVSGDMKKEIVQITDKIKSKKDLETYSIEYIAKQIVQHYRVIYKRKGI